MGGLGNFSNFNRSHRNGYLEVPQEKKKQRILKLAILTNFDRSDKFFRPWVSKKFPNKKEKEEEKKNFRKKGFFLGVGSDNSESFNRSDMTKF